MIIYLRLRNVWTNYLNVKICIFFGYDEQKTAVLEIFSSRHLLASIQECTATFLPS